ncbi:MAG: hypothetical protein ABIH50_03350 [bacterium]
MGYLSITTAPGINVSFRLKCRSRLHGLSRDPRETRKAGADLYRTPIFHRLGVVLPETLAIDTALDTRGAIELAGELFTWQGHDQLEQVIRKQVPKEREKLLWEFIMLDTWMRLLEKYSSLSKIKLGAPQPIKVGKSQEEGTFDLLYMTMCSGWKLTDVPKKYYPQIARSLGRLAKIKEKEKLLHGNYTLENLIFEAEPVTLATSRKGRKYMSLCPVELFYSKHPLLQVVGVGESRAALLSEIKEENEKLWAKFFALNNIDQDEARSLRREYQKGRDRVQNEDPYLGIVKGRTRIPVWF